MSTMVVAGRVEEDVKRSVDAIIRSAGITASDLIGELWESIAATGSIPSFGATEEADATRSRRLEDFVDFVDALPPSPTWLRDMDRDSMRDVIASRYV